MVKPVKTSDNLFKAQTTFGKSKYESTSKNLLLTWILTIYTNLH